MGSPWQAVGGVIHQKLLVMKTIRNDHYVIMNSQVVMTTIRNEWQAVMTTSRDENKWRAHAMMIAWDSCFSQARSGDDHKCKWK